MYALFFGKRSGLGAEVKGFCLLPGEASRNASAVEPEIMGRKNGTEAVHVQYNNR